MFGFCAAASSYSSRDSRTKSVSGNATVSVLVAHGDTDPADFQALDQVRAHAPETTPLSLMLLWQETITPHR